jgi:hypothetical protein
MSDELNEKKEGDAGDPWSGDPTLRQPVHRIVAPEDTRRMSAEMLTKKEQVIADDPWSGDPTLRQPVYQIVMPEKTRDKEKD